MSQPVSPPQMPQSTPMGYMQPGLPTRTSAAAVTSLICGILGCFIVTGIAAIITGIIGLKATKNPQVKGRGLAIAGLILGTITMLAGLGVIGGLGGFGYWAYRQYAPAVETMTALTDAASTGDASKAMPFIDSSRISQSKVQSVIDRLKPFGKPTGFKPRSPNVQNNNGTTTVDLDGLIEYPNNVTQGITVQLVKQSDGTFKVTQLDLDE